MQTTAVLDGDHWVINGHTWFTIQVQGGLGLTADTPLERMYREARYARICDGPAEVLRMVVARSLLGGKPAPWH